MKCGWILLMFLACLPLSCSSGGGNTDAGLDAEDAGGDADAFDAGDAGDLGDGDAGSDDHADGDDQGDGHEVHGCEFPFAPPEKHILIDDFGQEFEAWDRQVLCSVRYAETDAQVFLVAEPYDVQFMDYLYQARDAWVCEDGQVTQLTEGSFAYEAKHHGWDVMDIAFGGLRYSWGWSEVCVGWRPCTPEFDIFDVYDAGSGNQLDSGLPTECARLTMDGNPLPLVPQVRVPAEGDTVTFDMGSADGAADEQPVHEVVTRPVRMDVREATWADFALFLNDQGNECEGGQCLDIDADYVHLETYGDLYYPSAGFEDHPVVGVSWYAADAYCKWRSWSQLPSEAHWEMAAGACGTRSYPWGEDTPTCDLALFEDCGESGPGAVCSLTAGNSREGTCDLAGNVAEWIADWYAADFYDTCTLECNNPAGPDEGSEKVVRGGSFASPASGLRAAARGSRDPATHAADIGVRCAHRTFPQNR